MKSEKMSGGVPGRKHDEGCLKRGAVIEQSEHPWASPSTARRIAQDHLASDPAYYHEEEETPEEEKKEHEEGGYEEDYEDEDNPPDKYAKRKRMGKASLSDLADEY